MNFPSKENDRCRGPKKSVYHVQGTAKKPAWLEWKQREMKEMEVRER